MFATFVIRIEDVTEKVAKELRDGMTEAERAAKIQEIGNILAKEAGKVSKDEITQKMCSNEMLDLFYGAPTIVIVSYENADLTPIEDVSAASQNMLLAAESLNIASCWNGIVRMFFSQMDNDQREEFGIPENYVPHIVLAFGYPKIKVMNIPQRNKNYRKIIK